VSASPYISFSKILEEDFSFSQRCCLGLKSPWMWRCRCVIDSLHSQRS